MAEIHWEKNNYFIHYCGLGLDMLNMLGYFDKKDDTLSGQTSIESLLFDGTAKQLSIETLREAIPQLICKMPEGMRFDQ